MDKVTGANNAGNVSDVRSTGVSAPRTSSTTRPDGGADLTKAGGDDVNISARAQALAKLSELPEVREELVTEMSNRIKDPNFVADKLSGALDRMISQIF